MNLWWIYGGFMFWRTVPWLCVVSCSALGKGAVRWSQKDRKSVV